MDFLADLWAFLKERKKWWLFPVILVVLLFGGVLALGGASALSSFIYALF
jgi:hypothetical protein